MYFYMIAKIYNLVLILYRKIEMNLKGMNEKLKKYKNKGFEFLKNIC